MRNIWQTVRDREFVSKEHHYKVAHGLPKKGEIFDLRWPWKVKVSPDLQFCSQNSVLFMSSFSRVLPHLLAMSHNLRRICKHTEVTNRSRNIPRTQVLGTGCAVHRIDLNRIGIGRRFMLTNGQPIVAAVLRSSYVYRNVMRFWVIRFERHRPQSQH